MQATVNWVNDFRFIGRSGSGHGVIMDGSGGKGDGSLGPSPMEMLLLGLGGCTGIDVVHILKKMRQPVIGCEVDIDGTRADDDTKVFTKIHAIFTVTGTGLAQNKVEQAVALSAEKYCSVSMSLNPAIEITREVRVIEPAAK